MPISELMLPPWVKPETPERIQLIDDQTIVFQPQFARNSPQIQSFSDPRWGWTRRYRGMRQEDRSMLLSTLNEMRGKAIKVLLTPHAPFRGSFSASELITNGTFANSINGYGTSDATVALSASERVLRLTQAAYGDTATGQAGATVVANFPYVMRVMLKLGRISGTGPITSIRLGTSTYSNEVGESSAFTTDGYKTQVFVPSTTTVYPSIVWYRSNYGVMPNDYVDVTYLSLTRCIVADVGVNKVWHSQDLTQSYWGRTGLSAVNANSSIAPDGSATAEALVETNSTQEHLIFPNSGVASGAASNWSFSAALKPGTRTIARLAVGESTSSTLIQAWFNLNSGTAVTNTLGTNWSNLRTYVNCLGNGWWECAVVGRNTNGATLITPYVALASSNAAVSYPGSTSNLIYAWRPTLSASGIPGRLVNTGASSDDGGSPNGGAAAIKGGPLSVNGLILPGDWVELVTSTGSELKQVTAPLNTDAFGRGYLQFRPGLTGQMLADAPIVVTEPFGRFKLLNGIEYDNLFGLYSDANQLEFTEVYA